MTPQLEALFEYDLRSIEQAKEAQAARQAEDAAQAPTLGESVGAAARSETLVYGIWKRAIAPSFLPDPSYRLDLEEWKRLTEGIPVENHGVFHQARSREHAEQIRKDVQAELADKRTLDRAGWTGIGLQMGAAVLDPVQAVLTAVTGGTVGALSTASKVGRFTRGGAAAGIANAAAEVGLGAQQYTRDPASVAMAAGIGFALGGPLALLSRAENRALVHAGNDLADAHALARAVDDGVAAPAARTAEAAVRQVEAPVQVPAIVRLIDESRPAVAGDEMSQAFERAITKGRESAVLERTAEQDAYRRGLTPEGLMENFQRAIVRAPAEAPVADDIARIRAANKPTEGLPLEPQQAAQPRSPVAAAFEQADSARKAETSAPSRSGPSEAPKRATAERPYREGDTVHFERAGKPVVASVERETAEGVVVRNVDTGERMHVTDEPSFVASGSVGSAQQATIELPETFRGTRIKIGKYQFDLGFRFDMFAKVDKSQLDAARRLNRIVFEDAAGKRSESYTDANGVKHTYRPAAQDTMTGWAHLEHNASFGPFIQDWRSAFDEWAMQHKPSMGEKLTASAQREFSEAVAAEARGIPSGDKAVQKAAQAWHQMRGKLNKKARDLEVDGADLVPDDPRYVMRQMNQEAVTNLVNRFGPQQVAKVVEGALLAGKRGPDLTPEKAALVAKTWLRVQRSLAHDDRLQRFSWGERDFQKLEETLKNELNVASKDAQELLEYLTGFVKETTDVSVRYKPRLPFDETHRATLVDPKTGEQVTIGFQDFLENDIRFLANRYSRQISGLIGQAKVGIKSTADWEARIAEVTTEAAERGVDPKTVRDTVEMLEMGRKWAMGVPLNKDPLGNGTRIVRFVKDLNFIRLMGQAGFAQIPEVANLVGMAGMRAFNMHMPALRDFINAARSKPLDTQLSRQLDTLVGTASASLGHSPIIREMSEVDPHKGLSVAERAASQGRDFVAHVSGLRAVNYELKKSAEVMFAQRLADQAHGIGGALDDKARLALASDGLEEDGLERVMERLKKHTVMEGDERKLVSIDTDRWAMEDPESLDLFRMTLHRQTNRAIQEVSIGEAPWFIHNNLWSVLTQFRGFMLGAWGKQTLYGMNHMDARIATAWGLSSVLAGMTYVAQTSINYAQNQKELDKRLTLEKIASASFSRAGYSSLMPMGIDTFADMALNEPLFGHARTTGQFAGAVMGVPTVDLANKVYGVLKSTSRTAFDEQHMWTQREARSALSLLFLTNTYGVRNVIDAASQEFPRRNPLETYQPQ